MYICVYVYICMYISLSLYIYIYIYIYIHTHIYHHHPCSGADPLAFRTSPQPSPSRNAPAATERVRLSRGEWQMGGLRDGREALLGTSSRSLGSPLGRVVPH